ncbi:FGGY-family carbohydrate kinase [Marinoscillum furvescens]|uniref:Sugar (Pentulose or hexulose) kinase n=1 Tax=Marinoscillum furvescens DSM 4134 TaxID=1122208 RepID=A0A3D9LI32_MARFU|nr:FGGY family carbohydrate kinase [Marinoscillum furvescens]REE05525.1 sugar (pentulose or hexulose) kinase [Marinoscillum furvescens DSM 4134]
MKVTAVFDIGKTNKKFVLFDQQLNELHKEYITIPEIQDEDGDPCDDLEAIVSWMHAQLDPVLAAEHYDLQSINYSTYGASLVHLDESGRPVSCLYNYLKPYPPELLDQFYSDYGPKAQLAAATASPQMAMLNSGMQLYWLKHRKPEVFKKIHRSLHFPQYLSYVFSGQQFSEYTSIGCHTNLWDFAQNDYHQWVKAEGLDQLMAPIAEHQWVSAHLGGKEVQVGVGIHDSSAALLPYLKMSEEPFVLLSTGTWSIAMNPFSEEQLTEQHLASDCLNFLRTDGAPVRVSRLFLGSEYSHQVQVLADHYGVSEDRHKQVTFEPSLIKEMPRRFRMEILDRGTIPNPEQTDLTGIATYEAAYHQLMVELVEVQVAQLQLALEGAAIAKIYIDGGFADNQVFVQLLQNAFPHLEIRTISAPLGSSLGAALEVADEALNSDFYSQYFLNESH